MRKPKNSGVLTIVMDKEVIEIETDEVSCRVLAICGPENESHELAEYDETKKAGMEIVCADDDDSRTDLVCDLDYQKYLAKFCDNENLYLLEDNARESSPLLLMYNVDNEAASARSKGRVVENKKSGVTRNAVSGVSRTKNGREVRKSVSRTVIRIKETKQKEGDGRRGKKIAPTKKTIEPKTASDVEDTRKKKKDVRRGRKSSAIKNNVKACKKEKEESSGKRNAKSPTILRASKRLKTEKGRVDYNTKTTQRKIRKIPVTKNKVDSKSKSHVKEESVHKFKAFKKENEKSLSLIDKSYACYIEFLRNSLTIFQPEQQVKDLVALTDPDIIAISNHPFPDGGNFPFEANKDGKIIDVEDGIVSDDMFDSSFCKKLIEILRMPYDNMEFLELKNRASLKRPLTRNRELRDGRGMTYQVLNKFTPSFLQQYPDFKKMFRRYEKDCPRALNLLRGFFFYLKNIVYEGAFKPWEHEKRLMNMIK